MNSLFNKISKRVEGLRPYDKYEIGCVETSWFPKITNFHRVWLNDEDFITITYVNWEKMDKSKKIFQSLDEEDPVRIEIEFKKKDLILALQIMIGQVDDAIGDEGDDKILFNDIKLPIRQPYGEDKEEDSMDGLFVMLDNEEEFVNIVSENIKETNIIKLIFRDSSSFKIVWCMMYSFENYYFDENYLFTKEYNRIEKILKERYPERFKD